MQSAPVDPAPPPVQRADARRNRERILQAARAAFTDADEEVSMAEVSRRAGVGMATLYRNFPSRRDLLEALWAAEVDQVCAAASVAPGATPADALREWLCHVFAFAASKKVLAAELLQHVPGDGPVFAGGRDRVLAAGRPLYEAAQRSGQVRADLTVEQALDMLVSIATIDGGPSYRRPILMAALDGLAPSRAPEGRPVRP